MKLNDKVAVVTGAASGIGRAIATLFAAEGASVIATDVNQAGLDSLTTDVKADGGKITSLIANVAIRSDVEELVDVTLSLHERLDVLCNNAGVMDQMTSVVNLDDDLWQRVFSINVDGAIYACRKAVPVMLTQGRGVIINIASISGLRGGLAGTAYTASKHALIGLTKNIAWQYADQGVRCVALCPGTVETEMTLAEPDAVGLRRFEPLLAANVRDGKPEEIAQAALFLASDAASFVNGTTLVVDGGWMAG